MANSDNMRAVIKLILSWLLDAWIRKSSEDRLLSAMARYHNSILQELRIKRVPSVDTLATALEPHGDYDDRYNISVDVILQMFRADRWCLCGFVSREKAFDAIVVGHGVIAAVHFNALCYVTYMSRSAAVRYFENLPQGQRLTSFPNSLISTLVADKVVHIMRASQHAYKRHGRSDPANGYSTQYRDVTPTTAIEVADDEFKDTISRYILSEKFQLEVIAMVAK